MIVNLRGTHGSGKSTVVRAVIDRYPTVPVTNGGRRPEGYRVGVPWLDRPVMVVGPYTTACGGCDAIQPFSLIFPLVDRYAAEGHVLFEGALVSTSGTERVRRMVELYGSELVVAVLDTPLGTCLERILARRRARGDDRPLNPKNTTDKYNGVLRCAEKARGVGARVVTVDHRRAVAQVLGLFNDR